MIAPLRTVIDALVRYRIRAEEGVRGITEIPLYELSPLSPEEIRGRINTLVTDEVLAPRLPGKRTPFILKTIKGERYIVVYCRKTADEIMHQYRKYLSTSNHAEEAAARLNNVIEITLDAGRLWLNRESGAFQFNDVRDSLNPIGKEFRFLEMLMCSREHYVTYQDILGDLDSVDNRRLFQFNVRDLKIALGILPEKEAKNKDIFKSIRNNGYQLIGVH